LAGKLLLDVQDFTGEMPMLKEHTPVWVWDSYWWQAHVIIPELDAEGGLILVRFDNGVTAPVKVSRIRLRDPGSSHPSADNFSSGADIHG
jgi:hypothetical protein